MKTRWNSQEQEYYELRRAFLANTEDKTQICDDFPKYIARQKLARYLARHKLFELILDVKGSIVECGVANGGSLLFWSQLSRVYEPYALNREVIGFDTFQGFVSINAVDGENCELGDFSTNQSEIQKSIDLFDKNRALGHVPKTRLVAGDACQTIPAFFDKHTYSLVALLMLDFDLYEPTKVAIETILPRMPKGAVIAFDEVNARQWPGETKALLDCLDMRSLGLKKFGFEPYLSYAVL